MEDASKYLSTRKARMLSLKTDDWAVGQNRGRTVRSLLGSIGIYGCLWGLRPNELYFLLFLLRIVEGHRHGSLSIF